jgi:hypothetical protein
MKASASFSPVFPPLPRGLKGRSGELATLVRSVEATAPTRLALVGSGGSGKSVLACALGHRMRRRFEGRIHWFRVGAWGFHTLLEMLALGFGTSLTSKKLLPELRAFLKQGGERLVVLDNHEDDRAMCQLLRAFSETPTTLIITARRCLLAGVLIYPVTAPLVSSGRNAFPRVAALTRLLRWNPLALDIADAIVASGAAKPADLAKFLNEKHVQRVHVIAHEDDLPEVALLVAWAWQRLPAASRRILGVLAHTEGDHMDPDSLAELACVRGPPEASLASLQQWHLVQEPISGRYTVHAVVRYAVSRKTVFDQRHAFEHYVSLLEREPERLVWEQTHLFAALDHAHRTNDLGGMLRVNELLQKLARES